MGKYDISGKLADILHADVAGLTQLVQQDEQLAHERIRNAIRRFSDTIVNYHGRVHELRGDALLALAHERQIYLYFDISSNIVDILNHERYSCLHETA